MDDDGIRILIKRLSRPHPSGGSVIERAAILAEGADSAEVLQWITAHAGEPEDLVSKDSGSGGLHGARHDSGRASTQMPLRYVIPPDSGA